MDNRDLQGITLFFAIIIAIIGSVFLAVGIGDYAQTKRENNKLKREAIQNNFAEMIVEKDHIVFKWKIKE